MKDQQINSFGQGMMKDLSATSPQEGSYVDAKNIRIMSDASGSENASGIIIDIAGNTLKFSLDSIELLGDLIPSNYVLWESTESLFVTDLFYSIANFNYTWESHTFILVDNYLYYNNSEETISIPLQAVEENEVSDYIDLISDGESTPNIFNFGFLDQGSVAIYSAIDALDEIQNADVVGHSVLRNTLVLFCILKFTDDVNHSVIISIDLEAVDLSATVVYTSPNGNSLNFNKDYPIEAVSRYESEEVQKVYWTDNLNPVKSINIKSEEVLYGDLDPSDLNLITPVDFNRMKLQEVSYGGELTTGVYQYAYRLVHTTGSETRFSPLTNSVVVVSGSDYWNYNEDPENQTEYNGSPVGEISDKQVTLTIENVDQDYDYIEVAAISKNALGVSGVDLIAKEPVTPGSIQIIHSTSNNNIPITIEEVTAFEFNIATAKTLSVKDNILFLGNVTSVNDSFKMDATVKRFKRNDTALFPYKTIETESYDTFNNPFNTHDTIYEALDAGDLYRYKEDGITLGGQGDYVEFEFTKKKLSGNISAPNINGPERVKGEFKSGDVEGDYKDPYNVENFLGYTRDEVYRFGLVFYDLYGNPGFVNWVGDIRFPALQDVDVSGKEDLYDFSLAQPLGSKGASTYIRKDNDPAHTELTDINQSQYSVGIVAGTPDVTETLNSINNSYYNSDQYTGDQSDGVPYNKLYALGISFTLKSLPPELEGKVSGYSFVRVPRNEIDKSILGMGAVTNFLHKFSRGDDFKHAPGKNFSLATASSITTDSAKTHGSLNQKLFTVTCPDFDFSDSYPRHQNNFLQVEGAYRGVRYWDYSELDDDIKFQEQSLISTGLNTSLYHATINLNIGVVNANYGLHKREIVYSKKFGVGENIPTSYGGVFEEEHIDPQDKTSLGIENKAYIGDGGSNTAICSMGEKCLLVKSETPLPPNFYMESAMTQISANNDVYNANRKDKLAVTIRRKEAYKVRYNGDSNNDVVSSKYIYTGHFSKINSINTVQDVWGGDTYVTMYDIEKFRKFAPGLGDTGVGTNVSGNLRSWGYAFPVESTVNTTLRTGHHWANKRDFTINSDTPLNQFLLDNTYKVNNDTTVFIPEPINFITQSVLDTRVYYSNTKINNSQIDGWTKFKLENYKDLDGASGPITKLITHDDNIYFLQERGFGALIVNPTSTVVDNDGTSIVLGTGSVIQDSKYFSSSVGAQTQQGIVNTPRGIYWVDQMLKKAYAFRGNGMDSISDIHGMKSWFSGNMEEDSKIVLGVDAVNNEILFSTESETLAFNETINKFTSFYSYGTSMYVNTFNKLFSFSSDDVVGLYQHNIGSNKTFYEESFNSYVEFIVNKHPLNSKVFDNLEWYSSKSEGVNGITSARFKDSTQEKSVVFAETDTDSDFYFPYKVVKERMNKTPIPRTVANYRFRDTYIKVKLVASKNTKLVLDYVKTMFRISRR